MCAPASANPRPIAIFFGRGLVRDRRSHGKRRFNPHNWKTFSNTFPLPVPVRAEATPKFKKKILMVNYMLCTDVNHSQKKSPSLNRKNNEREIKREWQKKNKSHGQNVRLRGERAAVINEISREINLSSPLSSLFSIFAVIVKNGNYCITHFNSITCFVLLSFVLAICLHYSFVSYNLIELFRFARICRTGQQSVVDQHD